MIERAYSVYWNIKYKILSVYAQTYGAKYFIEDFKGANSHLLPTHPKFFIAAWHMHVAGKWQILIKQSFQRLFSPLSGRNSKLIKEWDHIQSGKKKSVVFMNKIPILLYICFLEWNWIKKNENKKLKTNCTQRNNWQDDFLPLENNLQSRVNRTEIMWRVRTCLTLKIESKY